MTRKSKGEYYTIEYRIENGPHFEIGNWPTFAALVTDLVEHPERFPESEGKILLKKVAK